MEEEESSAMAEVGVNNVENGKNETENNILYELLTYEEWQQEPEILSKVGTEKSEDGRTAAGLWGWLGSLASSNSSISSALQRLRQHNMEWHFAAGGEGKVVAILQDQSVEIRSSKDEYTTVIGRGSVPKDAFPQWRKVAWSPDCGFLAVASSTGRIDFFDTVGSSLFRILEQSTHADATTQDFGFAIAGMVFTEARVFKTQWSYEFITVNHRGKLWSYLLSPSDGYRKNHSFSFGSVHSRGVACVGYHPSHQVLYVGSCPLVPNAGGDAEDGRTSAEVGVTAWRFLSDYPHYKLITTLAEDAQGMNPRRLLQKMSLYYKHADDMAYILSPSPSGRVLAVAHTSGALSFWRLPALMHIQTWQLEDLPRYDDLNPSVHDPGKRKVLSLRPEGTNFAVCDMNWWSDEALIVGRYSGSVQVVSLQTRRNLLGESPEWFEFSPEVSGVFDRGFLTLECEWQLSNSRAAAGSTVPDDGESSDDETFSVVRRTTLLVRRALYYVTDSERFVPPRRKPKFVTKSYRLLGLKSTTPEELFANKIDNEEYGEALALAQTYGLDSDLVYRRQWRRSTASVASIQDYLSKITKCTWVLHECLERVPDTFEAARELLEFGLRGTDVAALLAMGEGTDEGRFIADAPPIFEDLYGNEHLTEFQLAEKQKSAEKKWREEHLRKVDFASLTLSQRWLCECRLKLLIYLDRLTIYEIQENLRSSPEQYDAAFFERFRSQPPLEAALVFARQGNVGAVSTLMTYAGDLTLPHWLPVLSNFPETLSPNLYADLLPEARWDRGDQDVLPWFQRELREKDWCEENCEPAAMMSLWESFNEEFYEENPSFRRWWTKSLTSELLSEWYAERAREIEELSWLVENALELTKLGCMKHVKGLEQLHDDLLTLETLTYECRLPNPVSLSVLEAMSESEKMQLLMSMCSEGRYVPCIRDWLLPFVDRCERARPGSRRRLLAEYLTSVARTDLLPCVQVFEHSDPEDPSRILDGAAEVAELALECVYGCEREDQLDYVLRIVRRVPQRGACGTSSKELQLLHDRLDVLEKHIEIAECAQRCGANVTVKEIGECEDSHGKVDALLKRIAGSAIKRSPPMTEEDWKLFLEDLLLFQQTVFKKITSMDCIQIVAYALLRSGNNDYIKFAAELLTRSEEVDGTSSGSQPQTSSRLKLAYKTSLDLALTAAREYIDSAASHSDPCLTFARACLLIMEGSDHEVSKELDFIEALPLLYQFKVAVLPVQVRHSDKMELIREALRLTPKAYKQPSKFLHLASLLRLHGEDSRKREGAVLSLLAEAALEDEDYKCCYEICSKLIAGSHSEGWKTCRKLGQCSDFSNLEARQKLLSFALCHCPDTALESLLAGMQLTEVQQLYDSLNLPAEDWFSNSDSLKDKAGVDSKKYPLEESGDSVGPSSNNIERTWDFLGRTTGKTRAVLTTLGSTDFWKGAVKNLTKIRPHTRSQEGRTTTSNSDLKRLGLPTFYASLHADVHIGNYDATYQGYAPPELSVILNDLFDVLRASMLCELLKKHHAEDADAKEVRQSVLLGLAKAFLPEDVTMCFGCLFGIPELEPIEDLFLSLPSTPLVLQLASYFFALRALVSLHSTHADTFLHKDSVDILSEVEEKGSDLADGDPRVQRCVDLAVKFHRLQADLVQAELLRERGGSVDVSRFAGDDRYKTETILGMALTTDEETLQVAVSLARRYGVPLWDVYACHLEFLFSEGCGVSLIESRLQSTGMLEELIKEPERLRHCLASRVFQSLDGTEHSVMMFYYALLMKCGSSTADESGLTPRDHLRLLRELRSTCQSIDYKSLVSSEESSLEILAPFLSEENVHVLAEMAPNIPNREEGRLSASSIYCLWASKLFLDRTEEHVMTIADWSKHFDKCKLYLSRLSPGHLVKFVELAAFSDRAWKSVSRRIRKDVVKQCLNMAKENGAKNNDDRVQWSKCAGVLQKYIAHLQRIEDGVLDSVMDTTNPAIEPYAIEFELTKGIPEKLEEMLLHCAMSNATPELLQSLLSCCPPNTVDKQTVDVYSDAVVLVARQLREPLPKLHKVFETVEPEAVLELVLQKASSESEESLFPDLTLEMLRPFCLDTSIDMQVRLKVLEILERNVTLSEEDANLLLLLRMQTLVLTEWPDYEIDGSQIINDATRQKIFEELLGRCSSVSQCMVLGNVLRCGPTLLSCKVHDPLKNPWPLLITKLLGLGSGRDILTAANKLFALALETCSLNLECCERIFRGIRSTGSVIPTLKAAFQTDYSEIHEKAVEFLITLDDLSENDYDDEVLDRILALGLLPKVAPSLLYQPAAERLITNQNPFDEHLNVDRVARQLVDAGMDAEAGTLLLQARRTHPSLTTFSAALSAVERWLRPRSS